MIKQILLAAFVLFHFYGNTQQIINGNTAEPIIGFDNNGVAKKISLINQNAVLVFVKGGWDKASLKTTTDFQESQKLFKKAGYDLYIITPDQPTKPNRYDLNSSPKSIDITYSSSESTFNKYNTIQVTKEQDLIKLNKAFNVDLSEWQNKERPSLINPSVFIIKNGFIVFNHQDYKRFLSADLILSVIQELDKKPTSSAIQKPWPSDVNSIDSIVVAPLNCISKNKGEIPDWRRFKTLFSNNATIEYIYNVKDTINKKMEVDEFIEMMGGYSPSRGMKETQIATKVDEYNGIATVFQSYKLETSNGNQMGVNTYQLVFKDGRWYISSLLWSSNINGIDVPEKYLTK